MFSSNTTQFGDSNYWALTLSNGSLTANFLGNIGIDSGGDMYVGGNASSASTNNDLLIAKVTTSGNVLWQKKLASSGTVNEYADCGCLVDSSDNIYAVGGGSNGNYGGLIAKYNTSGTLQSQYTFADGTSNIRFEGAAIIDPSTSIIYGIILLYGGIACRISNGSTKDWANYLFQGTNGTTRGVSFNYDKTSMYWAGYTGSGYNYGSIIKVTNSGTFAVTAKKRTTFSETLFSRTASDSSENIYVVGQYDTPSIQERGVLAKYDSSFGLQWVKLVRFNDSTIRTRFYQIQVGSDGFLYVMGTHYVNATAVNSIYVAKFDTSGSAQWQRLISVSSNTINANGFSLDEDDNLLITGNTNVSGVYVALLLKLPSDGSVTGTYGSFTISTASPTISNGSSGDFTLQDFEASHGNAALTVSSGTLTAGTFALTTNKTSI
jgi:hypothetical protein